MADASSLQYYGTQATLAPEQPYVAEHCLDKNPRSKKFWLFLPDMIKESFQDHFVILLTYLYFWKADMLIDHPWQVKNMTNIILSTDFC